MKQIAGNLALSVCAAEPILPIGTAVVGAGYFGRRHALCYARLAGSQLQALIDPDPVTQSLAEQLGVPWYSHVAHLPSTVGAVSVATPIASHYELAKALLERGLDVLLEKPIAETVAQAMELQMLAKAKNCILQIGHIERFNPAFKAGPALLPRARTIRTKRTTQRPPRIGALDVVIDLMIHDLDLILYGVACPLIELDAYGLSHGLTPIDEAQVELVLANGCRAHLSAYWGSATAQEERHMIAELDNNEIWMMDFNRRASYHMAPANSSRNLGNVGNPAPASPGQASEGVEHDTLSLQLASFLDASRHRAAPRVTSEDGYAALGLAQRIRQRILESAQ
ncbi:Gfo/Idh/MocA family oxidoreductase [Nitrosovibrio tenuis]|uniref:Predicted dehydrogenase n=1 Tax=Nitrosovibrio tenuis TaxID=1233 RepID=A0A1H7K0B7_9PROT|nr:Gfo/Idh/MocA family oxidoreductase [Nitrosovibrio tenuis]SEK80212.1 Predicted dehydrogenase [Nitrosovibrio tenuis]